MLTKTQRPSSNQNSIIGSAVAFAVIGAVLVFLDIRKQQKMKAKEKE